MSDKLRDFLTQSTFPVESPIEAMFSRCFVMLAAEAAVLENDSKPFGIELVHQQQIGKYRVDFSITLGDKKVVVECDGHDFHERNKEQASRDKSRDRELVTLGYRVMRFTGSEIWANPFACASQVLAFLRKSGGV